MYFGLTLIFGRREPDFYAISQGFDLLMKRVSQLRCQLNRLLIARTGEKAIKQVFNIVIVLGSTQTYPEQSPKDTSNTARS